jgi:pilus assembly protein CpaB
MTAYFGARTTFSQTQYTRNIALITSAFFLTISCIAVVILFTSNSKEAQTKYDVVNSSTPQLLTVFIPIQDIPLATPLTEGLFRREQYLETEIPKNSITDISEIKSKYAKTLILADYPLNKAYITPIRSVSAIDSDIPNGRRAVTIKVDKLTSIDGWVKPGSRVDVNYIATKSANATIETIVHNALILSVERKTMRTDSIEQNDAPPTTITLLATPTEANRIQLAQTTGMLSLVLRGLNNDGTIGETAIISENDLRGNKQTAQKETYKGTLEVGQEKFLVREDGTLNLINPS